MELKATTMEEVNAKEPQMSHAPHKGVRDLIEGFLKGNEDVVRVEYKPNEYVSPGSARTSFAKAVVKGGYDVTVMLRNRKLYLVRNKGMK